MEYTTKLTMPVAFHREALRLGPRRGRPIDLHNLGIALRQRFDDEGSNVDLEEAVNVLREAVKLCPPMHPYRRVILWSAGSVLLQYWSLERTGYIREESITYLREAHHLHSDDPDIQVLINLASALSFSADSIAEAEALSREALSLCPSGHSHRPIAVELLVQILTSPHHSTGALTEDAIPLCREVLELFPHSFTNREAALTLASDALLKRGNNDDIAEAVKYVRELSCVHLPANGPVGAAMCTNLATALVILHERQGKTEDLEEAISLYHLVLPHTDDNQRLLCLAHLGSALRTRFELANKPNDLEAAMAYLHEAHGLCPSGHPGRAVCLTNLAHGLETQFDQDGDLEHLTKALSCIQETLDLRPAGHPDRSDSLINIGSILQSLMNMNGDIEDVEVAISSMRDAVALCPPGHHDRSNCLNNLANVIEMRFKQWGNLDDLEEAIGSMREALALTPHVHPLRPQFMLTLGRLLSNSYSRRGVKQESTEALELLTGVLEVTPSGHTRRPTALRTLVVCLQQGEYPSDSADSRIQFSREALKISPRGSQNHFMAMIGLADALKDKFSSCHEKCVIEEAIQVYNTIFAEYAPRNLNRHAILSGLSASFLSRFTIYGDPKDLEAAIDHASEALDLLPENHSTQADAKARLGSAHLLQWRTNGNENHADQAFSFLEAASNHPNSALNARLTAAMTWASLSWGFRRFSGIRTYSYILKLLRQFLLVDPEVERHHRYSGNNAYSFILKSLRQFLLVAPEVERHHRFSGINAYSCLLKVLRQFLLVDPEVERHQELLSDLRISFASDAAAAALKEGEPMIAVEYLEEGRGLLWSRMTQYRQTMQKLADVDKNTAEKFQMLSSQLSQLAISNSTDIITPSSSPHNTAAERRRRNYHFLSEEWDRVVAKIQNDYIPDFLRPAKFDALRKAAAAGPVIILNVSSFRSDAIILFPDTKPPTTIALPQASLEELQEMAKKLSPSAGEKVYRQVLRKLWRDVIAPVAKELQARGIAAGSRIWICPTSVLCGMPLHAAGPYNAAAEPTLSELFVVSYTATLSSLIRARETTTISSVRLLAIAQPETLKSVNAEVHEIEQLGDFVSVLIDAEATRDRVLSELPQHSWAHFACHGHLSREPFQSSFQLHNDQQLTLLDLMEEKLPNAEFAFLSTCDSAAIDIDNAPDEVMSLASALQFSGFKSVVGTLWAMYDGDGPTLAKVFYEYMLRRGRDHVDCREAAFALNRATTVLREAKVPIARWANFIHIGV